MTETGSAAGWADLAAELDRWGEAGRVAVLWWRDDDAVDTTPQLEALLRLAGPLPLALAVIPALAQPGLAAALAGATSRVAVLPHGWQHANRAEDGGKKSEYPDGRSATVVETEMGAGRARLGAMFGRRMVPLFVPPWNRLAARFLPLLAASGLKGVSAMARPGPGAPPVDGLARVDVHLDVVAWRGDRGFIGAAAALGGLLTALRARRLGAPGSVAPIGILTHHLVMDRATENFLERLVTLTGDHPALRWASASELLA